jgi:hypothetical protein
LSIENPKYAPGEPGTTQVKTAARPENGGVAVSTKAKTPAAGTERGAASLRQGVAGEENRRSQRVLLRVRTDVHVALQGKVSTFEVRTLSVNNHGALIVMPRSLAIETRLVLEHALTKKKVACRVVRLPREMPEGFHTALEFDTPDPNFWGIAFPRADWRPPEDM